MQADIEIQRAAKLPTRQVRRRAGTGARSSLYRPLSRSPIRSTSAAESLDMAASLHRGRQEIKGSGRGRIQPEIALQTLVLARLPDELVDEVVVQRKPDEEGGEQGVGIDAAEEMKSAHQHRGEALVRSLIDLDAAAEAAHDDAETDRGGGEGEDVLRKHGGDAVLPRPRIVAEPILLMAVDQHVVLNVVVDGEEG